LAVEQRYYEYFTKENQGISRLVNLRVEKQYEQRTTS